VGTRGAPSPRGEWAATESTLEAGTELPIIRMSVEVPVGAAEVPVGAVEAPPEPSRKRKRSFSSLR
jgi:hypothetical protein